jgi:hypothetical protein
LAAIRAQVESLGLAQDALAASDSGGYIGQALIIENPPAIIR